jgi:hypothetical protein
MRTYPIDSTRVHMISTGTCKPSPLIEKDRDGKWGVVEGKQAVDQDTRQPLWTVEVIIPGDTDDDRDRTAVTEIEIAAKDRPDPGAFGDVLQFEGLTMTPGYLKKATNQVTAPRWSASGIRRQGQPQHKPQAA